jgi:hypothetical protein
VKGVVGVDGWVDADASDGRRGCSGDSSFLKKLGEGGERARVDALLANARSRASEDSAAEDDCRAKR